MNKKNIILIVVINILLTITKFFIIFNASMNTFLADDVVFKGKEINYLPMVIGGVIAIILDLIVNYLAVRIANKKDDKKIKYYKVIIIPIIITITLIIFGIV